MLKHLIHSAVLTLAALMVLQSGAFAEGVEGRVSQADPSRIDIFVYDAQGRPYPNVLPLRVDRDTRLNGIRSVSDLKPNDPVGAEVRQMEAGTWRADSVTLYQEVQARPATPAPSNALRDILGNPVAKGALVGAATGAIAASASHGKAGKGALIGAGVGAAAGLLEGLLSQGSDRSSDTERR